MNCECLAEYNAVVSAQDSKIAELKDELRSLACAPENDRGI